MRTEYEEMRRERQRPWPLFRHRYSEKMRPSDERVSERKEPRRNKACDHMLDGASRVRLIDYTHRTAL